MTPLQHIRTLFDALDEMTADETIKGGVYGGTRPRDGLHSVANTQSAESTYAAPETVADEPLAATAPDVERDPVDCVDPRTCPSCEPSSPPA